MDTKMNDNMIKILQDIKNKKLKNIECAFEEKWNRAYGYVRLNVDSTSIDISNVQEGISLFGEVDDVSVLKCFNNTGKTIKEAFNLIDTYNPVTLDINELINDVEIISEKINIDNKTMEFDMCIVIKTTSHTYLLSRENWFDEFIYINVDKAFDEVYPINKDKEIWDSDNVTLERTTKQI